MQVVRGSEPVLEEDKEEEERNVLLLHKTEETVTYVVVNARDNDDVQHTT